MTKRELAKDMQRFVNNAGVISRKELAAYCNCSLHSVDKYIRDLPHILGKKYFIDDVAESMMRLRTWH